MVLYLNEYIINEAISGQEVIDALNNRQAVLINYNDETSTAHPGKRYIEPYVYGATTAGNPCIRAYQYYGDTKRGVPKWKMFRLDRIESWEPTENTFELEPQARGWATEAYNNNGDGSMSAVYKTVDLNPTPQTEYEKLKAKTRELQRNKPLSIDQFKDRLQYPEERNKEKYQQLQKNEFAPEKPAQSGPMQGNNNNVSTQPPIQPETQGNISKPLQNNGDIDNNNTSPIRQEPKEGGPIIDTVKTNPQEQTPEELMSNDEFQKMLRRNLEITNQEKERRKNKKLQ